MQKALISFLLALTILGPSAGAHYNELRDDQGRLRPRYEALSEYLKTETTSRRTEFLSKSLEAFNGDNPLDPVPRILSHKEFGFIKQAVEQRARAFMEFLKDHHSGKRRYLKDKVIPAEVVNRAIIRAGESGFEGLINPETISFLYGPDIVRAEHNGRIKWFVLEDNTGYVGGLGDLILAHEMMVDLHPNLADIFNLKNPINFYQSLARHFRKQAALRGGIAVMYQSAGAADNEGQRIEQIMASLGIETVSPTSGKKLRVENGVVSLIEPDPQHGATQRKVGYIMMVDELSWVDRTHPATDMKHTLDISRLFLDPGTADTTLQNDVRKILGTVHSRTGIPSLAKLKRILLDSGFTNGRRSPVPGLVDVILNNKVGINSSPGNDFVSDKEIYMYSPNLIRYYLKEKPLIDIVPSEPFTDPITGELRKDILDRVFTHITDYVIKRFDGRGGGSVWVGSKLNKRQATELKKEILIDPGSYKAQERLELSRIGDNIVDLRLLTHVDGDQIIAADVPWGRGAPASGDGKVNISANGREVTVLVGDKRHKKQLQDCERRLQ